MYQKISRKLVAAVFVLTTVLGSGMAIAQSIAGSSPPAKAANPAPANSEKLDINSATKDELGSITGIGEKYAQKIIDGRPYRTKRDLLIRKIIPKSTYEKIKDQIIAHRTAAKATRPETHN